MDYASETIIRTNGEIEERRIKLSNNQSRWLESAIDAAKLSTCTQRHGAVLVKNGNVLAVGVNSLKNNPHNFTKWNPNISVHAEDAVTRVHRDGEADGGVVFVARLNANDEPCMSRPCPKCQALMREIGVKKCIWTDAVCFSAEGVPASYDRHDESDYSREW